MAGARFDAVQAAAAGGPPLICLALDSLPLQPVTVADVLSRRTAHEPAPLVKMASMVIEEPTPQAYLQGRWTFIHPTTQTVDIPIVAVAITGAGAAPLIIAVQAVPGQQRTLTPGDAVTAVSSVTVVSYP